LSKPRESLSHIGAERRCCDEITTRFSASIVNGIANSHN